MLSFWNIRLQVLGLLVLSDFVGALHATTQILSIEDPPAEKSLNLLFLGYQENTHHSPSAVYEALTPSFSEDRIEATFTNSLSDINPDYLDQFEALVMYGNVQSSGITSPNQPLVPILIDYVERGGALIGLHVASAAFRNDTRFAALLGGRFEQHFHGEFTPETILPNHCLTKGLTPLTSWDETYILKDLNPDITVLQERVHSPTQRFAWTWTRTQQLGRVFYTASGHVPGSGLTDPFNAITKPEFYDLVMRGIHWTTRRHFSSVKGPIPTENAVWGEAIHQGTGRACLWVDSGDGPTLLAVQDDSLVLDSRSLTWNGVTEGSLLPCETPEESALFHATLTDSTNQQIPALGRIEKDGTLQTLALQGQPSPSSLSGEIIASFGSEIGRSFVGNSQGDLVFRAVLQNPQTLDSRTAILNGSLQEVLSEGDTLSHLTSNHTISSLGDGLLTFNDSGNSVFTATLNSGSTAIIGDIAGSQKVVAIQGEEVQGWSGTQWGEITQLSLTHENDLFFSASLTGNVSASNDSVLARLRLGETHPTILVREGDELSPDVFVGELTSFDFSPDDTGRCFFYNTLTGSGVSAENDRALISVGDTAQIAVREGELLPAIGATTRLGANLGDSPLAVDPSGVVYFHADVISSGATQKSLLQLEQSVVFSVLKSGELLSERPGLAHRVENILPFRSSGVRGATPPPSRNGHLTIQVEATSGHRLVLRLSKLEDLDQDLIPNRVEAALAGDPNDSLSTPILPKIEFQDGAWFYTFIRPTTANLPNPQLEESQDLEVWQRSRAAIERWPDQSPAPENYEKVGVALSQLNARQTFLRLAF